MFKEKGSLSIEFIIVALIFLSLFVYISSIIYGYGFNSYAFDKSTLFTLKSNYEYLSSYEYEREIGLKYINVKKIMGLNDKGVYEFKALKKFKERFKYIRNNFSNAAEYIVYITDTGGMYHRHDCPTARMSLKPILKKDIDKTHGKCSVCHP